MPRVGRLIGLVVFFAASTSAVRADDGLITQRELSDMIPGARAQGALARPPALGRPREVGTILPAVRTSTKTALIENWALLPEAGYTPDQRFNGGFKFTGRDLTSHHITFDTEVTAAVEHQRGADAVVVAPDIFHHRGVNVDEYHYYLSPDKLFFGVGNNRVRSPLSVHQFQRQRALATVAYRATPDLIFAFSGGPRKTWISRSGEAGASFPATQSEFPRLIGINGGRTNPLIASFVYNNRASVTRPTQGFSVIGAVEHVNQNLANDFHFTRLTLDGSYLHPFLTRDQVIGLHIAGEFLAGNTRHIPFFELASLGGANDMRGFFPDRFLGTSSLLINSEYRLKAAEFDFRRLWHVQIDGVAFWDMGRVFISGSELSHEFRVRAPRLPQLFDDFRYSYGTGLRIALGEALVARIDVGFSNEQTGLVYLVFGHAF